tara:strand:- start:4454 stop:4687 length:234 start_codon:yes stop_codon:yes gene_type:complete
MKTKENTSVEGYKIPFDLEVCNLALKQLEAQAGIHSRYLSKRSHRDKLDAVNQKRKQIAKHLYHAHGVSKDELYLNA